MRSNFLNALPGIFTVLLSSVALATTPVGTWKTIDDDSGNVKSHVLIYEQDEKLFGKVTKIMDQDKQDSACKKCKGELKGQKINGMIIIWDMEKDGNRYNNGKIVDPKSGKVYSANMTLLDDGQKLEVRGYIGFSLLGRSQIWERIK